MPFPEPLAPEVMEIHAAELDAVHGHPVMPETFTVPVVAAEDTEVALGEIVEVQPAAWVRVKVWPAMVSVPERELDEMLAVTEYETVPLPVPAAPAVMAIHDALLVADQGHVPTALTVTLPVDAVPPTDALVGDTDELHGDENANVFD